MSNYMYYDYKSSTVCFVKENKKEYMKYPTIIRYLDLQCLENGSTYTGRKKSFQYLTKQKKFTPIIVSLEPFVAYFPTQSIKDKDCIWINYGQIKDIEYKEKECTIEFKDHTFLTCLHPKRIENTILQMKRYLIMNPNCSYSHLNKMNSFENN